MSNKRITELSPMTSGSLDSQDLFVIVDRSFSETKNMSVGEFSGYLTKNLIPDDATHAVIAESSQISITAERSYTSDSAAFATNATSASISDTSLVAKTGGQAGEAFCIRSYTNAEINNLVNVNNGSMVYNSSTSKLQVYAAGSWVDLN